MSIVAVSSSTSLQTDLVGDVLRWMRLEVLPFWAKSGFNAATGLFHERLNANAEPDQNAHLRIRVQCRQVYVFSHAAALGWFPQGAEIALRVWKQLLASAYEADGKPGFVHLLTPKAEVLDGRRDSYDHAFAVLAAAWLYRATGERSVRHTLNELLAFSDKYLADDHGGLRDSLPASLPNRQNPQMHWFEAMLALAETGSHPFGLERATDHRRLLEEKLFDPVTFTIGEYYTADWTPLPGPAGQIVEPGHLAEWTWLLRRHEAIAGLAPSKLPTQLLQAALRYSCPNSKLLVDEALRDGTVTKGTRRIWLQTELLKAHIAQFEGGEYASSAPVMESLAALDSFYLHKPFRQGWVDQLDSHAKPMASPVQASILYHLFVALAEIDRVLLADSNAATSRSQASVKLARG